MTKKIRAIGAAILVTIWAAIAVFAWCKPAKDVSEAERRPLAQLPVISQDSLLSGKFMTEFEEYTLDQFPLRDTFRQLKSLTHYYVMQQKDNNGIYIADGYAAKLDYPLNDAAVKHAMDRLNFVYETYLQPGGSKVYAAVIPDKGYYLAADKGYPTMDYDKLFETVRNQLPWATHIDLTDSLSAKDYYFTDTHWRQEALLPAAKKLCDAMGVTAPNAEAFTKTLVDRPFYGVYYGQAALPMEPEKLHYLTNDLLSGCRVYNYETGKNTDIYDMQKLSSRDLYDVFLSGAAALLEITNPEGSSDRELVVFRDSFGSSMIPLLVKDYGKVTMVDTRYVSPELLGQYLEFDNQDVLFLYSTLILNSSGSLK